MKKICSLLLAIALLLSLNVTVFAAENDQVQQMSIDEYCSSENFSLEGLKELFPDYYSRCQEEYAQDKAMIEKINSNLDDLLEEGRNIALTDAKATEVVTQSNARGATLGTYGDILVSLNIDSGSSGFAGHAAIVSSSAYYTIESYAKSFSPINADGVQIYSNTWRTRSGALLVRPHNAHSSQYSTAAAFASGKVGLPYNWNFFNKTTTDKYYCSQLVWQAWLSAGINTETGSIPNGIIAPADLVNSSNTYVVTHIT